ncbi:MAG: hypothetical protein OTI36_15365 [Beijerinckiaceae bacterium]|nr:hypothetical protein [Beijerinckiaceae bacterium]
MPGAVARPLDHPHRDAGGDQQREDQHDQAGEIGDRREVRERGGEEARLLAQRDRDAGAVRGIGEVDAFLPLRRDGDRTDRRVEFLLLETAEQGIHVLDEAELVALPDLLGDPAPQIDAGADDRSVAVAVTVGRHVVDGDAERDALRLGMERRRPKQDGQAARQPENHEAELAKHRR